MIVAGGKSEPLLVVMAFHGSTRRSAILIPRVSILASPAIGKLFLLEQRAITAVPIPPGDSNRRDYA